jgi:hypothetical protein
LPIRRLQISGSILKLVAMSNPSIKATYTLDAATIRKLEDMARQRGISTSRALREVIKLAPVNGRSRHSSALKALDRLQHSLKLTAAKARSWTRKARAERRASSSRQITRKR